jgi:hypothetical protein
MFCRRLRWLNGPPAWRVNLNAEYRSHIHITVCGSGEFDPPRVFQAPQKIPVLGSAALFRAPGPDVANEGWLCGSKEWLRDAINALGNSLCLIFI